MRFISTTLRILSIPIAFIGVYTCVILIGFILLSFAADMNIWADKLDDKFGN